MATCFALGLKREQHFLGIGYQNIVFEGPATDDRLGLLRRKIIGVHPPEDVIPDSDLPWAHFLVPPSMGAGHNYSGTSFAVQGGETVFGFFLDGEDGQQPVILGSFFSNSNITPFKTWEKVMEEGTSGFAPFTADASIETGKHITPTHGKKQSDHGGLPDSNTEVIEQPEDAVGESGLREAGETFSDYKKRIKMW